MCEVPDTPRLAAENESHYPLAVLFLLASVSHAYVYATPDAMRDTFFPGGSASIDWVPTPAQLEALKARLGYTPKPGWKLYEGAEGYAVFDSQLGQHEPIDMAVLLDTTATVRRVEVLVYREAYGDAVRAEPFRKQFLGLGPAAPMRPGKEIRIVSGATISTRSVSTLVKRATALVATWLGLP